MKLFFVLFFYNFGLIFGNRREDFDGKIVLGEAFCDANSAIDADAASYHAVVLASKAQKNASSEQAHAAGESVAAALRGARV